MKAWFRRVRSAGLTRLDDELPRFSSPLWAASRACCCPGRPVVTVIIPPAASRPYPVDLLLCGHHFRVSQAALQAAGAAVYDDTGSLIMSGSGEPQAGRREPAGRC